MTKRPPLLFPVPPNAEVTKCRSCGMTVVWILTDATPKKPSKRMPLSITKAETNVLGERVAPSHFSDCEQADQWRKK